MICLFWQYVLVQNYYIALYYKNQDRMIFVVSKKQEITSIIIIFNDYLLK